ncbi:hypothetical protein TIFTF001_017704 [Ficus carica]|uniref:Uncharacterized protein n=1 Tax=Ficus carica TaxID=3494 RepID=A0AA88AR47_FICCA|nr:hypothetical protein TIFTF001_017704 [Ficus carica]
MSLPTQLLMPEMVPAATPNAIGYSDQHSPVAPPSITCKKEAPRNDRDTGVVSAVGTPMLKSARILMQGERQSFGKAKMTIPGIKGTGARLVSAAKEEGWSKRPMPGLVFLHGSRCSEHYTVRAYGLFRPEQGRWSAKVPVLGECPALNTAEYCRRQYFLVGEYVDINISPPQHLRADVAGDAGNGELAGSPIVASKTTPGFYARPSPINSEGQSAFSTIAYKDSSFCRELPKTAEDYQAKDLEDQCRQLPRSVDAAGSAASTSGTSSLSSGEATGPRDRTPNHLSGLSDIPSGSEHAALTSRGRAGAARLEEILRARPASVAGPAAEGGNAAERTASQASTSGRSGDVASDSTDPSGEEIHARQRLRSRGARVNDMKVYRRADAEMVELAGDRPVYTVDYYTSAVTLRYLAALRREFSIPDDVDLVVPGPNDLPSRPPSGHIALSAEYFRASLRLPLHPFLRQALTSFNVSPAQLNANAYRILVGCYVLWAAKFSETLPLFAFQNLYRMKTAYSSKGFYYFQGFKGTFITGCPDSDKQFKHLWFYAGGRWLHEHLSYFELPPSQRVPVAFRRGYVWTRAPHAPAQTLSKIKELRELSDPERS